MKPLFIVFIFFVFGTGYAANWEKVNGTPVGSSYVDVESLKKRNNVVSYTRLFDYLNPSPIGVSSSISKFTVDCISEKITWIGSVYYSKNMGKGKIIKEGVFNRRLFARPDSIDYATMKFVCNYKQMTT